MADMWNTVRRVLGRIVLVIFGVQVATLFGLALVDHQRKKNIVPASFPRRGPLPVTTDHNEITVYTYGHDVFDDMIAAIDSATDRICFETFIWKSDATGQRFRDAFIRAAERGVVVHLVWDELARMIFAHGFTDPSFYDYSGHPNITVRTHGVIRGGLLFWHPRNAGRNHRKILVVDGRLGFVGGYNIGQDYANDWRDTHARFEGPAALELENAFVDYWNLHRDDDGRLPEVSGRAWDTSLQVVRNVPAQGLFPIRIMYLEAIDRATERVWLTHAYLVPDEDLIQALAKAVERGADVRIIVPHRSNHIVADWVSRGFYRQLLSSGIRLFLYQHAMVHSKTAVIDDAWTTIGTANLDPLSMQGNYEINMEMVDASMAATMSEVFDLDLGNCVELTLEQWERRPMMVKFSEAVLRPLRPFM